MKAKTYPDKNLDRLLKSYQYSLPKKLIAQTPSIPRDSARLLIYSKKEKSIKFDTFKNLGGYLPKNAVLVFNNTRVIPARITVTKPSGGKARLLFLRRRGRNMEMLSDKRLVTGSELTFHAGRKISIALTVLRNRNGQFLLQPSVPIGNFIKVMEKYGQAPLPPYIKHTPLKQKDQKKYYQTIFAKTGSSAAAPTASLHFTRRLLANLKKQGIAIKFVNLDVGLGTFAPLNAKNFLDGRLHLEKYSIGRETAHFLQQAKKQGRPIFATGTTVARALESAWQNPKKPKFSSQTGLFIKPGYNFRMLDGLITNFHVPKSSLMMLVASLVGRKKLLELYQKAIHRGMRFYSFGDGMLVLP